MEILKSIVAEDGKQIAFCKSVDWERLNHSRVLITGASGLIGMTLVNGIMEYNRSMCGDIVVIACVRNIQKAKKLFQPYMEKGWLKLVCTDIQEPFELEDAVDYIIHGASMTSSRAFVEKPVETIRTAVRGTENILELAVQKKIKSMIYMSSMEVYGTPIDNDPLTEERMGYLNPMAVRSSYSESKQMAENLCVSYWAEYNVPVKVVRLAQTFGPGVRSEDQRVFAEFASCVLNGEDIRLQTEGKTRRMYLYTADAACALLTALTNGKNGEAYNAANPETFCSIKEMADMVAEEFGAGRCNVVFSIPEVPNVIYNPVQSVYLDTGKIQELGWQAQVGLKEMYRRMIACMR